MRGRAPNTSRIPQDMEVRKGGSGSSYTTVLTSGTNSFSPPTTGRYKFYGWAGGRGGNGAGDGGASGSYFEISKALSVGQTVMCSVGRGGWTSRPAEATTVTFPDGTTATAAAPANVNDQALATGGDVNLSGSRGGLASTGQAGGAGGGNSGGAGGPGAFLIGGGAGSPANAPMRGAPGGFYSSSLAGGCPGGGGAGDDGGGGTPPGGAGLIIVVRVG